MSLVVAGVLGVCALTVATSAQAATTCTPGPVSSCPRPVSGFNYTIRVAPVANAANLSAALGGSASHRTIDVILDNANRVMQPLSSCTPSPDGLAPKAAFGFCWNADDQGTTDESGWLPQGITTTADALTDRAYDNAQAVAVTWYSKNATTKKATAARVSLAPARGFFTGNNKYRHVLLVEPSSSNNFKQVQDCHAGGAMWYGNLLYVACTDHIRVFNWNYLHQVKATSLPGEGFGRQSDGKYYANGNLYVMVQWATITNPSGNVRFSSLSLDRLASPDKLVVSGYSSTGGVNLWRFDLDYRNRLPMTTYAYDAYDLPFTLVQGATSRDDRFWFNSSGQAPKLRFWNKAANTEAVYGSAYGAESVSYWPSGDGSGGIPDYLYTLTEHHGTREVLAVRQADFN